MVTSNGTLGDVGQVSPEPEPCIWPGCQNTTQLRPELHMCDAHLILVYVNVGGDHRLYGGGPYGYVWDLQNQHRQEEARAKREDRAKQPGTIYYVEVGAHIKIGWTSDITKRMRAYPPNSRLHATHPGTRTDETALHRRFATWRSHGAEWYLPAPALLEHIRRVIDEHGQPDTVDFGAKPVTVRTPRTKQFVAVRSRSGGSFGRR